MIRTVLHALRRTLQTVVARIDRAQLPEPKSIAELIEQARARYYGEDVEREKEPDHKRLQIEALTYSRPGGHEWTEHDRVWLESQGFFERLARKLTGQSSPHQRRKPDRI